MVQTAQNWNRALSACGVNPLTATKWASVFERGVGADTLPTALAASLFVAQIVHESGRLETLSENLFYSTPGRLMAVWPARFKSLADELPYLKNPAALAEKVYTGRMGNDVPGDGARYIGRGLLQITGKNNYRATGLAIGQDLLANPDLLLSPSIALSASLAWWSKNIPPGLTDVAKITQLVNGGQAGLSDRAALSSAAIKALTNAGRA